MCWDMRWDFFSVWGWAGSLFGPAFPTIESLVCSSSRASAPYCSCARLGYSRYGITCDSKNLIGMVENAIAGSSSCRTANRRTEMKVMVLVKATKDSEAGVMPTQTLLAEMDKFNQELTKAGVMLAGEDLRPSSEGKRVQFSGRNRTVLDGPFTETKELVAGFWLWQVRSIEEALEWVKRCPNPMPGDSEIEIRPIFDSSTWDV